MTAIRCDNGGEAREDHRGGVLHVAKIARTCRRVAADNAWRGILALFLLLAATSPLGARELVVSTAGKDSNPGTRALPLRTLTGARDALRAIHTQGFGRGERDTVLIRGGVYRLDSTFVLESRDGGSRPFPVHYTAAPGEQVRIIGGMDLPRSLFRPATDPAALNRMPASARAHVLACDLNEAGVRSFGNHRQAGHGHAVEPAPLELYCNGSVLPLAHYPDSGAITIGEVIDPGSVPRIGDYVNIRGGTFVYTDQRHAAWAGADDVWLQGFFKWGFADDKIRVLSTDTERQRVTLATPHMYGVGNGEPFNQYVALNLLEELTMPGEWYLDRATGMLYVWPPSGQTDLAFSVSVLEAPLIAFDRVSDILLEGCTVELGRGMGISVEGGERVTIGGCTIRNVGTCGIVFGQGARQTFPHLTADDYDGVPAARTLGAFQMHYYKYTTWDRQCGSGHHVLSCDVYNTGAGGITIGGGSKKDLVPSGSSVENCRVHKYNRHYKAQWAGINVDGCGVLIAHNEIFDADLQAIFVRGNDHVFEYNNIHHVALNSNDASAWYLGRDPSDQGNIVRNNFFHHVGRPDRKWMMGVYCDDATCNVSVTGNVFYKVASYGTVYSNGGHDIVVRDNIFIEGYGPVFQLKSMWYDFGRFEIPYFFGPKGVYRRRLTRDLDITRPPYSTHYPLLKDWFDLMPDSVTYVGMRPRRNVFERNLVVNYEETYRLVGEYAQCDFRDNFVVRGDPGFMDMQAMDFRLDGDAPVFKAIPGFQAPPFASMGLYKDRYRRMLPVQ